MKKIKTSVFYVCVLNNGHNASCVGHIWVKSLSSSSAIWFCNNTVSTIRVGLLARAET